MIRIDKLNRGRWGNKILHYNNLMQISKNCDKEPSCGGWDTDDQYYWNGKQFFDKICEDKIPIKPLVNLTWKNILEDKQLEDDKDYILDDYCLHNVFYKITKTDPREFLQLKDIYKPKLDSNYINVGIHIRGGDVITADNGKEIHPPEYYINSINLIEEEFKDKKIKYHVCTDDKNFDTYLIVTNYLIDNNFDWEEGSDSIRNRTIQDSDRDFIYDFGLLSECDILINSSSTFCICAGFLGKKDKKIIHYKNWLLFNFKREKYGNPGTRSNPIYGDAWYESFENFWIDLYNGGNEFYKIWKII